MNKSGSSLGSTEGTTNIKNNNFKKLGPHTALLRKESQIKCQGFNARTLVQIVQANPMTATKELVKTLDATGTKVCTATIRESYITMAYRLPIK